MFNESGNLLEQLWKQLIASMTYKLFVWTAPQWTLMELLWLFSFHVVSWGGENYPSSKLNISDSDHKAADVHHQKKKHWTVRIHG